jgi:translation elongation factor EF-Ts
MAGRIESYLHSDKSVPNKGGVIIRVTCKTDFAARTDAFITFCKVAAQMAYAYDAEIWADVAAAEPEIETLRLTLEKNEIKEPITVDQIVILKVE